MWGSRQEPEPVKPSPVAHACPMSKVHVCPWAAWRDALAESLWPLAGEIPCARSHLPSSPSGQRPCVLTWFSCDPTSGWARGQLCQLGLQERGPDLWSPWNMGGSSCQHSCQHPPPLQASELGHSLNENILRPAQEKVRGQQRAADLLGTPCLTPCFWWGLRALWFGGLSLVSPQQHSMVESLLPSAVLRSQTPRD